jgi:hypothetical protein
MSTQEDAVRLARQNEARVLVSALEQAKIETLGRVSSIISSEFQILEDAILTRYGVGQEQASVAPTMQVVPEVVPAVPVPMAPAAPAVTAVVPAPAPVRAAPVPVPVPVPAPQDEQMTDPTVAPAAAPVPRQQTNVPENLTNRLTSLKWYQTGGADYRLRNVEQFDPDIKAFWLSILGNKQQSDRLDYEGYTYQVVMGKENTVWLRRWGPNPPAAT